MHEVTSNQTASFAMWMKWIWTISFNSSPNQVQTSFKGRNALENLTVQQKTSAKAKKSLKIKT
jgi:hypothetical protein